MYYKKKDCYVTSHIVFVRCLKTYILNNFLTLIQSLLMIIQFRKLRNAQTGTGPLQEGGVAYIMSPLQVKVLEVEDVSNISVSFFIFSYYFNIKQNKSLKIKKS